MMRKSNNKDLDRAYSIANIIVANINKTSVVAV